MHKGPVPQRMLIDIPKGCICDQYPEYAGCCDTFSQFLNDCKVGLGYLPIYRAFYFRSPAPKTSRVHTISNCPWCGAKLPTYLRDEWDKVIEKEYGLNPDSVSDSDTPAEMLTDEWWKKRGL
jgi:hypothetical protein